jgi:hypothetical protein
MDLSAKLTPEQLDRAIGLLSYQPFILSDDIQTGAGYSWTIRDTSNTKFVCRKSTCSAEEWDRFTTYATLQRNMYDGWLAAIAERYPGGSLLDFGTYNSYFPVKAQLLGMGTSVGVDIRDSTCTDFLNEVLGTDAEFIEACYDPVTHSAPVTGRWDVVCASSVMSHLPDPLNFLTFLSSLAKRALFLFNRIIDTDALLIKLEKPNLAITHSGPFPYGFNWGTHPSRGLLEYAFAELGFDEIIELPGEYGWLRPDLPVPDYIRSEHQAAYKLGKDILAHHSSRNVALLAMRGR